MALGAPGAIDYRWRMRAARRRDYGPPSVIRVEEVAIPRPGAGELLVRVHAATVSRTDCALLSAQPVFLRLLTGIHRPRLETLGTDFSGEVAAVGAAVGGFRVGDRVWGINDRGVGSHAEYLVVASGDAVAAMPEGLSFAEAAASLEGAWYAYSMLHRAPVAPGGSVLINGATGAIGSALLQMCVAQGINVTAVGNTKNLALLRSLGAERVIDRASEDFTRDTARYDAVFDAVGKSSFGACRHLLRARGVYVSSELGPGWQNPALALMTPALGGKRVCFPVPIDRKVFLRAMYWLVTEQGFRPVIERTVRLETIRETYAYVASGRKTGNVVLALAD